MPGHMPSISIVAVVVMLVLWAGQGILAWDSRNSAWGRILCVLVVSQILVAMLATGVTVLSRKPDPVEAWLHFVVIPLTVEGILLVAGFGVTGVIFVKGFFRKPGGARSEH